MAENIGALYTVPEVWKRLPRFGMSIFSQADNAQQQVVAVPYYQPNQPMNSAPIAGGTAVNSQATSPTAPFVPAPWQGLTNFLPTWGEGQPARGIAIPPYYTLGPGDELSVRCWSDAVEHINTVVTVAPAGNVYLPLIGDVTVAGQTLTAAESSIRNRLHEFFTRCQVSVTVSQPRIVEVYAIGDVQRPGKYSLPGTGTIFTALYAAGGPSEIGSLRHVKLLPLKGEPKQIDLYSYLLSGERVAQEPLSVGDTIFVAPEAAEVGVVGEVRRSARYEITPGMTCADVLKMAGGISATGYIADIHIWRVKGGTQRIVLNMPGKDVEQCKLQDGDLIIVKPILEKAAGVVEISGAVRRPGIYEWTEGTKVADVIRQAEGLAETAHNGKALIWRLNDDLHRGLVAFDVKDALAGNPQDNVALQANDNIKIFTQAEAERAQTVYVTGQIRNPGDYPWGRGMRISDLIAYAGGTMSSAYGRRAFLWRLNSELDYTLTTFPLSKVLAGDKAMDDTLQPQDRIFLLSKADARQPDEVYVTGAVRTQGRFEWGAGMKVSDLIMQAGGLTPQAYGRQATLIRMRETDASQEILQVRLGEAMQGVKDADLELMRGDSLQVLAKRDIGEQSEVWIGGFVKYPGNYVRYENMKVSDLIFAAGGLALGASGEIVHSRGRIIGEPVITKLSVTRLEPGKFTVDPDVVLKDDDYVAINGEGAFVRRPPHTQIQGHVVHPGAYSVPSSPDRKKTVYDVIQEAGGLLQDANPAGILLFRPKSELWLDRADLLQKVLAGYNRAGATPTPMAPGAPSRQELAASAKPAFQERGGETTLAQPSDTTPQTGAPMAIGAPATANATFGAGATSQMGPEQQAILDKAKADQEQVVLASKITTQFTKTLTGLDQLGVVVPPRELSTMALVDVVPVDGELLMATKGARGNAVIMDNDIIVVERLVNTIAVLGAVAQSGEIAFIPGEHPREALQRAGGASEDADLNYMTILRVNGTALSEKRAGELKQGDIVVVPSKFLLRAERPSMPFLERLWGGLVQAFAISRIFQ